jgi:hypothetical protein
MARADCGMRDDIREAVDVGQVCAQGVHVAAAESLVEAAEARHVRARARSIHSCGGLSGRR